MDEDRHVRIVLGNAGVQNIVLMAQRLCTNMKKQEVFAKRLRPHLLTELRPLQA